METPTPLQAIIGLLTLVSAFSVVLARNAVVSAIMLMATLFLTGALYFGLGFYFVGAVQILVYAGAISVLFVFIVMLLDLKPFALQIPGRRVKGVLGALVGLLMVAGLALGVLPGANQQIGAGGESQLESVQAAMPQTLSLVLLSKYMLPWQVSGLLILAAVMGVVVLGRPKSKAKNEKSA